MANSGDVELSFYEKFFFARALEPYPLQEHAFDHIFRGESLLVTVPTGTGKTMIAKAAIHKALAAGQTAIYTTPLRALTEEKFRELCDDFGDDKVGFATGDYKVNPDAPVQVIVAEILWNRIYGDRVHAPADVVVMDEGHYFNDPERGHIWEQSILALDPRAQLVVLSATVGDAADFCRWVTDCRRVEMQLVQSNDRKVPLYHRYEEEYLIDVVKQLQHDGGTPAILFVFGREACFEVARLLKSCSRFTSDEERARIEELIAPSLLDRGVAKDLKPLLTHGIGIHHAGILPRYKQLVERLTLERLLKFVVSTETISAGINLPAKRVIFPSLRKHIQGKARLLTSAEYHQMAGRAGRPQFDSEGVAITLAPDQVVQEIRKEMKDAAKSRRPVDENQVRKAVYAKARAAAARDQDVTWDATDHQKLVDGKPAPLRSQTKVTAEQILAIGLPDLEKEILPGQESEAAIAKELAAAQPAYLDLNIRTVIDHLLLPEREKVAAHRRLAQVVDNLRALGIVDEHGQQVQGEVVNQLRGIDGMFVFHFLKTVDPSYLACRELVELLVDHGVIQKILDRRGDDKKREWIKSKLRQMRMESGLVSWEDAEAEYEKAHPRELGPVEQVHANFLTLVPHPELHGGKRGKMIWATMEDAQLGFMDFIEREGLQQEEGSLFSYLARVMKLGKMLKEATSLTEFETLERNVRNVLSVINPRVLEEFMLPLLDPIWIECAERLELPVARGGEAYVHWDGARLHLAGDEHLDGDDTVAQLVLHEICHFLVEGPASRARPDWGLDNTSDEDAQREEAAVRLQAHLTGAHGLRAHLFPTTIVRPFFESLPPDALDGEGKGARLARVAALRAAGEPFRRPLAAALAASALSLALPRHPRSGHPVLDGELRRCGDCAWRTDGGYCRQAAASARVAEGDVACARHEARLDCLACGACCRSAYDSVTVGARDVVRKRHPDLVVFRGGYFELRREGDRCTALDGEQGGPYRCTIYDDRPRPCRDFESGGRHCLTARRRVGLTAG